MLFTDIFPDGPDSRATDWHPRGPCAAERIASNSVVETEAEKRRRDVRERGWAKLCERGVEMNDGYKITRSVHVKGSIVVAQRTVSCDLHIIATRKGPFVRERERRRIRLRNVAYRTRRGWRVDSDTKCIWTTNALSLSSSSSSTDRQTDRRTSFKYRYLRRSGCEARRSLEEKIYARIIPSAEEDGSIRWESIRVTDWFLSFRVHRR